METGERYRGERAGIVSRVPPWTRRVLVVGERVALLAGILKRAIPEVHLLDADAEQARIAAAILDSAHAIPACGSLNLTGLDLVIVIDPVKPAAELLQCLGEYGQLLILIDNTDLSCASAERDRAGWPVYQAWPTQNSATNEQVLLCVPANYNPLAHAAALRAADRPDAAHAVLAAVPEAYCRDDGQWVGLALEKMDCVLAWMRRDGLQHELGLYDEAARLFHECAARLPHDPRAYLHYADLWRMICAPHVGARLLRTINEAALSIEVTEHLLEAHAEEPPRTRVEAPEWKVPARLPRVLFLMNARMHFGLDILYDGLCRVLGVDNVVEFPFKPSLHGQVDPAYRNYPCAFDYPGAVLGVDEIEAQLKLAAFDFVLYGDCEGSIDPALRAKFAGAAEHVPLYAIDALDEPINMRAALQAQLGARPPGAYFKREFVPGIDYGQNVFPLPFAYPDGLMPETYPAQRDLEIFWAGHRRSGLRRVFLEHIEAKLGRPLADRYPPEEYQGLLRRARIGLSLFGYGFDTVRYWELPASGAMLLAERLPIAVPFDFVDGQSAVFFEGVRDLEEKLRHYLAHPDEAETIARAGYEHAKRHHTSSARARQLLGWIQGLTQ